MLKSKEGKVNSVLVSIMIDKILESRMIILLVTFGLAKGGTMKQCYL